MLDKKRKRGSCCLPSCLRAKLGDEHSQPAIHVSISHSDPKKSSKITYIDCIGAKCKNIIFLHIIFPDLFPADIKNI